MKSAIRNFHLPLSEDLYARLRAEAKRRGRPATAVARGAIEEWLRHARRMEVAESISAYAAGRAGTKADLDEGFEAAGLDSWRIGED
jgi:predicted transcriptional regulator